MSLLCEQKVPMFFFAFLQTITLGQWTLTNHAYFTFTVRLARLICNAAIALPYIFSNASGLGHNRDFQSIMKENRVDLWYDLVDDYKKCSLSPKNSVSYFCKKINNRNVFRLPPNISRYTMLPHKQEEENADRYRIMDENLQSRKRDGMDSVRYKSISIKNQRLFTLIGVKL